MKSKNNKRFFSLQYKVMIFSIIITIIPLTIVGIISYRKSSSILMQKVSISNLNTVSQVGQNIEYISQDAYNTSLYLIQNDDIKDFFKLDSKNEAYDIEHEVIKIQRELMYITHSKKYIKSIFFKGFNGVSLDTSGAVNKIDPKIEKELIDLKGAYLWKNDKVVNYDGSVDNVISLIRQYNDKNNITSSLAIMKINILEDEISNIYKDQVIDGLGEFYIVDSENRIVSSIDKGRLGQKINDDLTDNSLYKSKQGYFNKKIGGISYLITYYNVENSGWRIINLVPLKALIRENTVIQKVMVVGMVVSFAICMLFAFFFSNRVLGPLKQMKVLMKKIEKEDFDVSIDIKGNDEIAILGRSFNKMSAKLNELINQVYIAQIKKKEAEFKALQAQVNPHFLYNTLDTIYWMGRMEKAYETSKLVYALSNLFRLSLNSGNEITTVGNEVEHLKNYITIQQVRYEDTISFTLDVCQDVLGCQTVKLILQPLVENAISHGFKQMSQNGKIDVFIRQKGDKLEYVIEDNGCGIDVDEANQMLSVVKEDNRGFGIKNVNDRIKLYFGDDFGLRFENRVPSGTRVIVHQPIVEGDTNYDKDDDSRR